MQQVEEDSKAHAEFGALYGNARPLSYARPV